MILPDINLLVHAHNADSAVYEQAQRRWSEHPSDSEDVKCPRV